MANDQRLMEMWRALPILEKEPLPRRSKVKTTYISSMLPSCWQLDWQEKDKLIIAYEGNKVDAMWGDTPEGENYLANYTPERQALLLSFYHALFSARCGATIVRSIKRQGGPLCRLATNFVPMLSNDGKRRIIFGNSEMIGDIEAGSGRLDFNNAELISAKYIDLGFGVPDHQPFNIKEPAE